VWGSSSASPHHSWHTGHNRKLLVPAYGQAGTGEGAVMHQSHQASPGFKVASWRVLGGVQVPIIHKQDLSKGEGAAPGLETCVMVSGGQGSQSLHIEEVTVAPNARIPRCINPHTEVAIIFQEGKLDALLGRERMTVGPGHTVLAAAGTAYGFLNRYDEPARMLFVFPTHQVEQVPVSVPGATSGFPSEKGLSGYKSPPDRPLGERS
jgi:quercetin dioxygenase-like cupin family protein